MKITIFTTFKFICLLVLASLANSCVNVSSQSARMREVENKSQSQRQIPAECLKVFREFFASINNGRELDIVKNEKAQKRWLTKRMQKDFAEHIKLSGKPEENPGYPSNATFQRVWNQPTTFSIVGSRHYDFRNSDNPNDNRAIVDVLYEWDNEDSVENQYPLERQLHSFIFVFEDGIWKLDDIYTFDDEYTTADSLRNSFKKQ